MATCLSHQPPEMHWSLRPALRVVDASVVLGDTNADDDGSTASSDAIRLTLVCRSFLIQL